MITAKLKEQKIRKKKLVFIWLFPIIFIATVIGGWLKPPIKKRGIHAVLADTGGGKTISLHLLSKELKAQGWTVYSNSKFNHYVRDFDLDKYFKDFEQIKPLENCVLILDEIQHEFNRRMNRSNDYNSVFVPFIKMLTTHRHDNIVKVYFITQAWDQLDTQIQRLVQKVHIVKANQWPTLYEWLRKDSFKTSIRPTSVTVNSFKKSRFQSSDYETYVSRDGDVKHRLPKKYKLQIKIEDLFDYNTHAFKGRSFNGSQKVSVDSKTEAS